MNSVFRACAFQAAEVSQWRNNSATVFHHARLIGHRGVDGAGIEAVVDRDIAGQRTVDALLGLERQHDAPAGHVLRPFDGVHADIGAAIDRDDAVAMMLPAQVE